MFGISGQGREGGEGRGNERRGGRKLYVEKENKYKCKHLPQLVHHCGRMLSLRHIAQAELFMRPKIFFFFDNEVFASRLTRTQVSGNRSKDTSVSWHATFDSMSRSKSKTCAATHFASATVAADP